jgi:hypothetical protein
MSTPLAPRLPGKVYQPRKRASNPFLIPIVLLGAAALVGQMFWLQGNQHLFRPFSLDRLKCERCGGVGVVRQAEDDSILVLCPACHGVGSHMVRRLDEEDKLCPACSGIGRIPDEEGPWRTCRRCDGRGLIRDQPWSTKSTEMFKDQPASK